MVAYWSVSASPSRAASLVVDAWNRLDQPTRLMAIGRYRTIPSLIADRVEKWLGKATTGRRLCAGRSPGPDEYHFGQYSVPSSPRGSLVYREQSGFVSGEPGNPQIPDSLIRSCKRNGHH